MKYKALSEIFKLFSFTVMLVGFFTASPRASYAAADERDIRDIMLESAKKNDHSFPDSKDVILTSFAYIGKLQVKGSVLYVVNLKQVLANMPAPRGSKYICLFDSKGTYLTKYRNEGGEPLWTKGDKLYMFGNYDGPLKAKCNDFCNVMKFDIHGKASLHHEKVYGSSGETLDE